MGSRIRILGDIFHLTVTDDKGGSIFRHFELIKAFAFDMKIKTNVSECVTDKAFPPKKLDFGKRFIKLMHQ